MKLLQFVFKLRIRLVEHTVCFAIKVREPIENDLLVGIILSNLPHNTRQTLYAHVTRGDAHTHTHTQAKANGDVASITSAADISFVIKKFPLFTCSTRCQCVCVRVCELMLCMQVARFIILIKKAEEGNISFT